MIDSPTLRPAAPPASRERPPDDLRDAATRLEAVFLAEMLKSAGLGASPAGGVGEQQFASFLIEAQAREMARAGGIGLAETLFQALSKADDVS